MRTISRTHISVIETHFVEIDGQEFKTTCPVEEFIEPKIEVKDGKTTLTYATREEYPMSPRDMGDPLSTMVVTLCGYDHIGIDEPDDIVEQAVQAGVELNEHHSPHVHEVYYAVICGCFGQHSIEEVDEGECKWPFETLTVGQDGDHFDDGSTFGLELMGGYSSLDSLEGVASMLAYWLDNQWADEYDLAREYLKVDRPDVRGFRAWGARGYSQSDWIEGYAYLDVSDIPNWEVDVIVEAEKGEYAAYFRGDVYVIVQECYDRDGDPTGDYDCVGGFYGDKYTAERIKEGDF